MLLFPEQIKAMNYFIEKEIDLSETHGFKVIGFFPYHIKTIRGNVRIPRQAIRPLEMEFKKGGISDNKIVVVCQDVEHFGTENFAVNLKDGYACFGRWEEIQDY